MRYEFTSKTGKIYKLVYCSYQDTIDVDAYSGVPFLLNRTVFVCLNAAHT